MAVMEQPTTHKSGVDHSKAEYVVRAKDVRKIFKMGNEETHALKGVSLDIRRGEYVSIITGFANLFRDARLVLDYTTSLSTNPGPSVPIR